MFKSRKGYSESSLPKQLVKADPAFAKEKQAVQVIKNGWIGLKDGIKGQVIMEITDPCYEPEIGEVFSLYDGMLGDARLYKMTKDGLKIVSE